MSLFRRKVINLMFTDDQIKFALVEERSKRVLKVGKMALKSGVIKNGKIQDMALLSKILGAMFRKYRLRSSFVKILIPDNNLVIKKFEVPKFLKPNDAKSYIKLELEEALQTLPYKDPIIDVKDYKIYPEKDNKEVILFTTSKEVISAYLKAIQKHRKSVIDSQISPILTRRIYLDSKGLKNTPEKHVMFAQIRQDTQIFTVFDNELPVLSLRDTFEIEEYDEAYYLDQIISIVERICHFYKYQFTNGDQVEKIVIYTEVEEIKQLKDEIFSKIDIEIDFIDHPNLKRSNALKNEKLDEYYLTISLSL